MLARFRLGVLALLLPSLTGFAVAQIAYTDISAENATWGGLRPWGSFRVVTAFDFDGDGLDDLLFGGRNGELRLLRNLGGMRFAPADSLLPADLPVESRGAAVWGDLDGDGDADLVLAGRNAAIRLLRNEGTAGFALVDRDSTGLMGEGRGFSANLADVNGDGLLDLYVAYSADFNRLYINRGDLRFTDETTGRAVGDGRLISMAAVFTDVDRDGDADLYCVHDNRAANTLFVNDGAGFFREAGADFGVGVEELGMGVDVGDFDGDLLPDLYVTNLFPNNLLVSGRRQGFTRHRDVRDAAGVGDVGMSWGTVVLDADHDGRLDVYVANESYFTVGGELVPNIFYRATGELRFDTVRGEAVASRDNDFGVAAADFDGDGDLDLAIATNGGAGCRLLRNDSPRAGRSSVVVRAPEVGAQGEAHAAGRAWWDETHAGSGFASQSAPLLHFGVGEVDRLDSLVYVDPGGRREVFRDVDAGATYAYEGRGQLRLLFRHEAASAVQSGTVPESLDIWPNPAADIVRVRGGQPGEAFALEDAAGRVVRRGRLDAGAGLDVRGLAPGAFTLRVGDRAARVQVGRGF